MCVDIILKYVNVFSCVFIKAALINIINTLQIRFFLRKIGCIASQDLTIVPGDCSSFYRCYNNILYVLACPTGKYFDVTTSACKPSYLVACNSTKTTSTTTEATTTTIVSPGKSNSKSKTFTQ